VSDDAEHGDSRVERARIGSAHGAGRERGGPDDALSARAEAQILLTWRDPPDRRCRPGQSSGDPQGLVSHWQRSGHVTGKLLPIT
jgi:hypothetical protein